MEMDNYFYGTEMATSKSESNSADLWLSEDEIGIDLASKPV